MELIVVDDGSTDTTKELVQSIAGPVRYIYQNNQGVSAARNRGVRESRGKYLAFLDSDDEWKLGRLGAQLGSVSDGVVSFEGVEWFLDGQEQQLVRPESLGVSWPRPDASGFLTDPILDVAEGRYFHLGSLLCTKSTFLRVGLFDERMSMGEDEDWFSRASMSTRFHYVARPTLRRRLHAQQISQISEESIRSLILVFSEIAARTEKIHPRAHTAAKKRLASKWSHLSNVLRLEGRSKEACAAAYRAFSADPSNLRRLLKVALISMPRNLDADLLRGT